MQTLNGQTGQTQTFQNDSNVTISSSNNTHTINWQGLLPLSRGGTGASSLTAGSILFSNGTSISQNNSNLFWDNTNNRLGIGTSSPASTLSVNGNTSISGNLNVTGNITTTNLVPYTGAVNDVDLGTFDLKARFLSSDGGGGIGLYNDGEVHFYSGQGEITKTGMISMYDDGQYRFAKIAGNVFAVLDFSPLAADKTFTFPNISGTFGLLETDQTWSGLNKFEASMNSTIYVGSSVKSGCIAMGDSDSSGVTYITANDGVLTASTTKPSTCQ